MDEDEVPQENRHLFITPTLHNMIDAVDTTKSKEVLNSFAVVQKVPQSRFYTAIDLYDGKTDNSGASGANEKVGGFVKASTGKDINFMVITVNKVISPDANQDSDGWLFFYRAYGLADVYENKVAGIYLHHKA